MPFPTAHLPVDSEYRTKQELAYRRLRHMVLRGILRPGEALVAHDVAKWFGVSSVPVREAIQRLKDEGFVVSEPHARAIVKGMSKAEALEVAEMRLLLEPAAAGASTPHVTSETAKELATLLDEMDRAVAADATDAYAHANERFHLAIYRHCPNARLREAITEHWELSQRFAVLAGFPRQIGRGQREHRLIFSALKGGDADEVRRLTHVHRTRVLESMKAWQGSAEDEERHGNHPALATSAALSEETAHDTTDTP